MKTTVHVEGLRALGEAMRELGVKGAQSVANAMTAAAARPIKEAAIRNVVSSPSVDTASLRSSIITKKIPKSRTRLTSEHIVTVRGRGKRIKRGKRKGQRETQAPHAHFVEFGTVNMPAEPFLRPAFDQNKEKAVRAMAETGRRRIALIAAKVKK